jgi:hypothetical protein
MCLLKIGLLKNLSHDSFHWSLDLIFKSKCCYWMQSQGLRFQIILLRSLFNFGEFNYFFMIYVKSNLNLKNKRIFW